MTAHDHWASIRERPRTDGTVCYSALYWLDGKQTSLPFDALQAAELFKQAVKVHGAQRALEMHGIKPAGRRERDPMTVAQWVRHHIDHLTGLEQYSVDKYNEYLANDIEPTIGAIPLTELQEEDVANWVKRMETEPSPKTKRVVKPKTIANKHGFLSGALAAAVPKHIPANPAAGRRLPRTTGEDDDFEDAEIRMLSRDEFDRLLAATTEPWRPLVEFLVASGCRWGEAVALKPGDVDRAGGTVRIRRAWKYSPKKGHYIGPPKTGRSRRVINVPTAVLDKLDHSHEWLFTNTVGGPVRYQGFRRRVWDKAVVRAQLDPEPTPHALRHTCASWMLAAGVPLTTVSRHLGHENVSVTADIYTDVDRTSFAAAADVMGEILGRAGGGAASASP
jgi:integrase